MGIGEIGFGEVEILVRADELAQPGLFERGVVIGVEIVDADDARPSGEERRGAMGADEARSTGDENEAIFEHAPVLALESALGLGFLREMRRNGRVFW